ncbi:HAD family hydrolase [Paenibacillus hamazuiensis]|uniref:HAD family hydrolase n=1 Tax=Paenibacillus hamazuiensis TaxID=2936508 RepID=UPI00200C6513|nr:HAD family hydrolase [Paenibacillus hamazuiensis]
MTMLRNSDIEIAPDNLELWKTDRDLRQFVPMQNKIELVSLDIFDTLLFRKCMSPGKVFNRMWEKAASRSASLPPLNADEFAKLRIDAEHTARDLKWARERSSEVSLREIYEQMPGSIGNTNMWFDLEIETESEMCYLNPNAASLVNWCKRHGKRVALLSDMYLPSSAIRSILRSAGLNADESIDVLLVSCEENGDKRSGYLFDRLLAKFPGISRAAIVHIGDSTYADIDGARSRNIPCIHYQVVPENFDSPFHWEFIRHGSVLPNIKSIRKLAGCSLHKEEYTGEEAYFHHMGASLFGPFLHDLCEWAVDECIRSGRSSIHPLMREGYLLGPMLERVVRQRGLSLEVKPLYVSRQALYLPSLEQFGVLELDELLQRSEISANDVFHALQLEMAEFARLSGVSEELLRTPLSDHPELRKQLADYLGQSAQLEQVRRNARSQRELLMRYLVQECGPSPALVTLDIGFNGTIQTALDRIFRLTGQPYAPIHLLAVGSSAISRTVLSGHDVRCYMTDSGENADLAKTLARTPAFLEELSMGTFGTTLGYKPDNAGAVRPELAVLRHKSHDFALKEACQRGIFAFQLYLDYFRKRIDPNVPKNRRQWVLPFHRLIDMPTPKEAQLLGDLTHQDNHFGEVSLPICPSFPQSYFEHGGDYFMDFCNLAPSVINAFWPQGIVTRDLPYYRFNYFSRLQDAFGRKTMLANLMLRIKQNRASIVHVAGSGGIADEIIQTAYFHGIDVRYLIGSGRTERDRPWGSFRYGTIDEAGDSGIHHYVIASLERPDAIIQSILAQYAEANVEPTIYPILPGGDLGKV